MLLMSPNFIGKLFENLNSAMSSSPKERLKLSFSFAYSLTIEIHLMMVCQSQLRYSAANFLLIFIARNVAVISKSLVNLEPRYDHGTDAVLIPCYLQHTLLVKLTMVHPKSKALDLRYTRFLS